MGVDVGEDEGEVGGGGGEDLKGGGEELGIWDVGGDVMRKLCDVKKEQTSGIHTRALFTPSAPLQ